MTYQKKNYRHTKIITLALFILALGVVWFLAAGCGRSDAPVDLRIFHAAGFTPILDAMREDARRDLGIRLQTESSGSQVAARKVEELGRRADLIILADSQMVAELLPASASWRIDFANDEIVLGVGSRAPRVDDAEDDWVPVLWRADVRFGRVDENQAPIGYRTLLVLKLEEQRRNRPKLTDGIIGRGEMIVDDVNRLAPLLRNGDLDYAFVYRSICLAMDIRFIELTPEINLGDTDIDYSSAEVSFEKLGAGERRMLTVKGSPATWALTVPDRDADAETALRFVRYMLEEKRDLLAWNGFRPFDVPLFFGPRESYEPISAWVEYGGPLR